jgi:transcriptional regulator with XRE-family HTH domain
MPRRRIKSPDLQRTYDKSVGRDPKRIATYEEALADAEVGMMVHELRVFEGLTQAELARRIGTTASAISRIESADYRGHSLAMLRRIAGALGKKVAILFLPEDEKIEPSAWIMNRPRKGAAKKRAVSKKPGRPGVRVRRSA